MMGLGTGRPLSEWIAYKQRQLYRLMNISRCATLTLPSHYKGLPNAGCSYYRPIHRILIAVTIDHHGFLQAVQTASAAALL